MPDERPSDRLLTYAELGDLLGISADGARTKAKRAGWPVIPGNDGRARVRVAIAELPERPPEQARSQPERSAEQTPSMTGLAAELRARAERAERSAEQARAEAEQTKAALARAELALARAEERAEAVRAVAIADVATARAEIAAQELVLAELRQVEGIAGSRHRTEAGFTLSQQPIEIIGNFILREQGGRSCPIQT